MWGRRSFSGHFSAEAEHSPPVRHCSYHGGPPLQHGSIARSGSAMGRIRSVSSSVGFSPSAFAAKSESLSSPERRFATHGTALAVAHWSVLCVSGYLIASSDAMKQLLMGFGVASNLRPVARELRFDDLLNVGFGTSLVAPVPVAFLLNAIGPRFVGVLGLMANFLGIGLLASPVANIPSFQFISTFLLGIAAPCICNAHVSVLRSPRHTVASLTLLLSGVDISLAVPSLLLRIGLRTSPLIAVIGYSAVGFVLVIVSFCTLPRRPNVPYSCRSRLSFHVSSPFRSPPHRTLSALERNRQLESNSKFRRQSSSTLRGLHESLAIKGQIMTPTFLAYLVFFAFNIFAKNYFFLNIRSIFAEGVDRQGQEQPPSQIAASFNPLLAIIFPSAASAPNPHPQITRSALEVLLSRLNFALPLSWIASLTLGLFTSLAGLSWGITGLNLLCILLFSCATIVPTSLQIVTFIFFIFFSSHIIAQLFVVLSANFGFKTVGALQAVQSCVAALALLAYRPWLSFIESKLGGRHTRGCAVLAGVACVFPLLRILWYCRGVALSDSVPPNVPPMNFLLSDPKTLRDIDLCNPSACDVP